MIKDTFSEVSKFITDPTKIVFTTTKGIPWFGAHTYSEDVLKAKKNNAHQIFHNVMTGVYKNEMKPFIKYAKFNDIVVELFETGGPGKTPVMDICGLLQYTMRVPKNDVAQHIREMATKTLVNHIIGDKNHINDACANAALSDPIQELLRNARDQQRASGGPSIAAPAEQVLDVLAWCAFAVLCLTTEPLLHVPVAQGGTDVALRLSNGVCILTEASAKLFLETEKMKTENEKIRAETKKVEAEKMESEENKAERAHVLEKKRLDYELHKMIKDQDVLDRASKRTQKDLDKEAARERQKMQIDKAHELAMMEKQWDLQNRDPTDAAGASTNAPAVPVAKRRKSKSATPANAPMVPLAIYKRSNTTTPLTQQQKLNKSNKAKQERLDAKAYRASLAPV